MPIRLSRRHFSAGFGLALAMPTLARAQSPAPLNVVAFAGASNWPMWIGSAKGFFAAEGIAPTLALTPNSRQMASDVFGGKFDIALTSIDNVVAYVEGQGEAQLPGAADFVAFMGVDDGMLALMAVPGTASVAALKGQQVAVDAMTTGFAFVLRDALLKSGLKADDVQFVAVGGGAQRLQGLNEKKFAATLLNSPLDLVAEANGAARLADMHGVIGPYQGISGMARRPWLEANKPLAVRFAKGFRASVRWLVDPANKAESIAILRERLANTSPELAERIHAKLTDPVRGIRRDLSIDPAGLQTVLRLRSQFSNPPKGLTEPARYLDLSVLAAM
ncbi:TauA ABC-type nitrate/sulfonate/bicarbonate transport systems, periplasmic components [Rhabdaerophilaceae bacterium]